MDNVIHGIPLYVIVPIALILLATLLFVVLKALKEGREISFWPPRVGPRVSPVASQGTPKRVIYLCASKSPERGKAFEEFTGILLSKLGYHIKDVRVRKAGRELEAFNPLPRARWSRRYRRRLSLRVEGSRSTRPPRRPQRSSAMVAVRECCSELPVSFSLP